MTQQEKTMTDTTTRPGRVHTDLYGLNLEVCARQHKTTGRGTVSISEAVDATDAYWSFTTDQARKIARDLLSAADLADAAEAKFQNEQALECGTCHPDGDYTCPICFPGGEAPQYLTGVCGQRLPCNCTDCQSANQAERPVCPLHDDPDADGMHCTCDQ
jgi:hypothetical protein